MKHITASLLALAVAATLATPAAHAGNGPSFTAVVNSDGTLARGLKATGAVRFGTGTYEVDFTKDITACGYTLAVGLSGNVGSSAPGTVNVVGRVGNPNGIFVQTFDELGVAADRGFHVIVTC
jgi:hypothetical protein